YHLYPISRPHAAVSHLTNLVGATRALRAEGRAGHAVALAGSYDSALALNWSGVVPPTPLVFLYHSEFFSEWVQAQAGVRVLLHRYMGAIERRVFSLSARIVAVSRFSARQIAQRAPGAASRVRIVPTGVETDFFTPASSPDESAP